jgi:hypothetical protein
MDDATRSEFVARIKRDVAGITPSEQAFVEHCAGLILRTLGDERIGPVTFLMPDEQAIARIDVEGELPAELREPCLGLLLDQVILSKLDDRQAGEQFSTLGGATATLSIDDDTLVLADTTGRRVRVGKPIVDGPRLSLRPSDDLLMWDEWAWT